MDYPQNPIDLCLSVPQNSIEALDLLKASGILPLFARLKPSKLQTIVRCFRPSFAGSAYILVIMVDSNIDSQISQDLITPLNTHFASHSKSSAMEPPQPPPPKSYWRFSKQDFFPAPSFQKLSTMMLAQL
ncbi:unnamed protein product [Ilex paraguariensis]|uniref:Uncharacterized protein n=1 Tax=Ilex paraguariensis TaxID=185542 RepID=A0ABC8TXS3_9AQUA